MNIPENPSSQAMPVHRPIYKKWWFWVIATPLILFIAVVIYRIPFVIEKERTEKAVAQIHAQKLTIEDVNGEHLPPPPDPAQADATIEGVDANANGIRDDVELAIFKKYPNSAKIRAAELQYAKALQMELMVFNSEVLVAAIQERGRGFGCIFDAIPKSDKKDSIVDARTIEIENLVFNTEVRKSKIEEVFDKYMTSFSTLQGQDCDLTEEELFNET